MVLPGTCPRCHAELEVGTIVGQMVHLDWIPEGGKRGVLTIGREHLATGSLVRGPSLDASRCPDCHLALIDGAGPTD